MTQPAFRRDCDLAGVESLGRRLGELAEPGLFVALVGGLGAGKTTFVRAVVAGAGGDSTSVSSPTFVLVHEYDARLPIFHLDVYRLKHPDEFLELGGLEELPDSAMLVEWADRISEWLPPERLEVALTPNGADRRIVEVRAFGERAAAIAERLG